VRSFSRKGFYQTGWDSWNFLLEKEHGTGLTLLTNCFLRPSGFYQAGSAVCIFTSDGPCSSLSLTAFLLQCSGAAAADGPGGRLGSVGPAGPPRVGLAADQVSGRRSHPEQAGGTAGSSRDFTSHRCQGIGDHCVRFCLLFWLCCRSMFLGVPDLDPLVRCMDPYPYPSIIKQK
jgi:hypothetical protein